MSGETEDVTGPGTNGASPPGRPATGRGTSIRTKLMLGVMALFILPSAFLGFVLPRQQAALATRHVEEKARTLVHLLSHSSVEGIRSGSTNEVRRAIAGAFNLSEILYIRVRDREGRELFTYDPLATPVPTGVIPGTVRRTDDLVTVASRVTDDEGVPVGDLAVALSLESARAQALRSRWMGLGAGLLVLLLGVPLAYTLARKITDPISRVVEVVAGIQGGEEWDLTRRVRISSTDETAALAGGVNRFLGELESLVRAVQRSAAETDDHIGSIDAAVSRLASSAEDLGDGIEEISTGSTAQAEATARNVDGARDVRELSDRILDRATEMAETTGGVARAVRRGADAAGEATAAIGRIDDVTRESREVVAQLESNAWEIDRILDAIDAISRQTRLLAFNASIEAVRGGGNDSGFGVVVDEVGKLAVQTRGHAREIGAAVTAIGGSVEETVDRVERIEAAVASGRTVIAELEEILGEVQRRSRATAGAVETITDLIAEQREALDTITGHAEEVARIAGHHDEASSRMAEAVRAQQAATGEASRLAGELSEMAESLGDQIRKFRVSRPPAGGTGSPGSEEEGAPARSRLVPGRRAIGAVAG